MRKLIEACRRVAKVLVIAFTLLFLAGTLVGLYHHRDVTQTGIYTVMGFAFAGLCVIASWHKETQE